jgi:hypothetical protein
MLTSRRSWFLGVTYTRPSRICVTERSTALVGGVLLALAPDGRLLDAQPAALAGSPHRRLRHARWPWPWPRPRPMVNT